MTAVRRMAAGSSRPTRTTTVNLDLHPAVREFRRVSGVSILGSCDRRDRLQHNIPSGRCSLEWRTLITRCCAEGVVTVDQKTVDAGGRATGRRAKAAGRGRGDADRRAQCEGDPRVGEVALIQAAKTLLLDRDTPGNMLNLGGDSGLPGGDAAGLPHHHPAVREAAGDRVPQPGGPGGGEHRRRQDIAKTRRGDGRSTRRW